MFGSISGQGNQLSAQCIIAIVAAIEDEWPQVIHIALIPESKEVW